MCSLVFVLCGAAEREERRGEEGLEQRAARAGKKKLVKFRAERGEKI
jgi:hypothetical protein